jgi:hypothetical protein
MAKATEILPRRRFLQTAAIGAAAVLPIPALAANPDAELLELHRRFRELVPAEVAARAEARRMSAVRDQRLKELFPDVEAYYGEHYRAATDSSQEVAYDKWNAEHDKVSAVAEAIKETLATTLLGLLAKAEVMVWRASSWSCSAEEFPLDRENTDTVMPLDLVVAMFAAAGQPLPYFIEEIARSEERARSSPTCCRRRAVASAPRACAQRGRC